LFDAAVAIEAQPRLTTLLPPADATITAADLGPATVDPITGLITINLLAPRASWTPNLLRGKFLLGADALQHSVIYENTNQQLRVTQVNTPGSAPVGTLQIMEPSADITCTSTPGANVHGGFAAYNCDSIAFNGLRITTPTPNGFSLEIGGQGYGLVQMCEIQSPLLHPTSPVGVNTRANRVFLYGRCRFAGQVQLNVFLAEAPAIFNFIASSGVSLRRGVIENGTVPLIICQPAYPGVPTPFAPMPATWFATEHLLIRNMLGATVDGIRFHGVRGKMQQVDISNCGRDAVRVDTGVGFLELVNCGSTLPNGVSAPGFGVNVTDGMYVKVDVGTDTTQPAAGRGLRGSAGNEIKVGVLPNRTWVNFTTVAPIRNQFDLVGMNAGATDQSTGSRLYRP
jgi:hypothetical protein